MASTSSGDGGYDYEFVDTPLDMLICKICYYPSREPYLSDCCGHTFCKSCVSNYEVSIKHPLSKDGNSGSCPVCCSEEFNCVRNKQTERVIKSLKVLCINKNEGCKWQGEINNIDSHLAEDCKYSKVDCPNGCGKSLQRQHLNNHIENECIRRTVSCPLCHTSGEKHFVEGQHKHYYCPKFPLTCPNECGSTILREETNEHRKICLLEKVDCANNCGISLQRQSLSIHVSSECPCRIVSCEYCQTSGEFRFIEGQHKDDCPKFTLPCPNNCEVENIPRKQIQIHLDTICPLEVIQCEYHAVGCGIKVTRKDMEKHKKERIENHLSLMTPQIAKTHDTLNMMVAKFRMKICEVESAAQKKIDELEQKLQFKSTMLEILVGEWTYKINSEALKPLHKIVPVIVRMPQSIDKGVWTSDTFFTHTEGYKITLSMTAAKTENFLKSISYFSLHVYLMDGPYDDNLPWPMNGMVKITLLNQIKDSEHYPPVVITYFCNNPGKMKQIGFVKRFISCEGLHKYTETCQFLKFCGLLFQIDIC